MKVYIATPITSRKEATMEERFEAAQARVDRIREMLKGCQYVEDVISAFDLAITPHTPEGYAMGKCVQTVIESDVVVFDDGWQDSRGCQIEREVATSYGKTCVYKARGKWQLSNTITSWLDAIDESE